MAGEVYLLLMNFTRLITASFAALSLCSCLTEPVEIAPDPVPQLSVEEIDPDGLMAKHLPRWSAAIGVLPEEVPAYRIYYQTGDIECGGNDPSIVLGCARLPDIEGRRSVVIREGLSEEAEVAVAAHEIGHLLGAWEHTDGGVMNSKIDVASDETEYLINQDAIDQICDRGLVTCRFEFPETAEN